MKSSKRGLLCRRLAVAVVLLAGALLVGCGPGAPKLVPVSGTVTLNGRALSTGSIQFIPAGQRPAYAQIGPDGRFQLMTDDQQGCVVGVHKVVVHAQESAGDEATGETVRQITPVLYGSVEFTPLSVTIEGPQSDLHIELTGQP